MIEKSQIVQKSAEMFRNYGIKSVSMDDISSNLGISKKTLYQLVTDKNQLIDYVVEAEYSKIKNQLAAFRQDSNNQIEELIRINSLIIKFLQSINPVSVFDLSKYYPTKYEQTRKKFKDLFVKQIIENIKNGKADGLYRVDINEEVIAQLHSERIEKMKETNTNWAQDSRNNDTLKEMTTYYLRGLITKKGEPLLETYLQEFTKYLNE